MYGHIHGGIPPAAGVGGALAATGTPGLGVAAAVAVVMVITGVALIRRGRLAADAREQVRPPHGQG
ncbi:hypothetical protein GCM10009639_23860 [Kitasatospora putterlickiae]|uniref:Uncharacterized protein n=1 Tax=Kitasatospora putterlickiae TaxID=221725 RepID=A0ABN1XXP6_9ACTN